MLESRRSVWLPIIAILAETRAAAVRLGLSEVAVAATVAPPPLVPPHLATVPIRVDRAPSLSLLLVLLALATRALAATRTLSPEAPT